MIVRVFRARVRPGFEADFMEQQRRAGDQAVDGLLGHVGARQQGDGGITTISISFWRDIEAIQRFTRGALDRPVVTVSQHEALEDWSVDHYESFEDGLLGDLTRQQWASGEDS